MEIVFSTTDSRVVNLIGRIDSILDTRIFASMEEVKNHHELIEVKSQTIKIKIYSTNCLRCYLDFDQKLETIWSIDFIPYFSKLGCSRKLDHL